MVSLLKMDPFICQDRRAAGPSRNQRVPDWEMFESFRRQEISFIKLNLAVIAALALVHVAFGHAMGYPSTAAFALLFARFVEQSLEFRFLSRRQKPFCPRLIRAYSWASPLAGLLFAFLLTVLCAMDDAHYHVLMVIPIIAVAFRFPLRPTLGFVVLASALTILGVLIVDGDNDQGAVQELFESVTTVLIYFIVGSVVWVMADHLRRDMKELRKNYEQLGTIQSRLRKDERLAAVGRLASAIAHEIRNPVAAISSSLAAAEGDSLPQTVRQEMLHIAAREAGRLEKLTSDFLSYARARPPDLRPTQVADAVKYVADLMAARAAESSVAVIARCGADLRAMIDDFQLHGALLNLVLNAIEACPPGASVEIGAALSQAESGAPTVEIQIQNSGPAIPVAVADKIFEPFVTTKPAGTGLGLAIARNVAVAHGGTLELTENRPEMIRFTFTIPFHPCPEPIAALAAAAPTRSRQWAPSLDDSFMASSESM